MPDVQLIGQMISEGKWVLAFAALAGLGVRLLKDDAAVRWFPFTIPAEWRPAMALALGVVAAVVRLKGGGLDWKTAVLTGVVEGLTAGSGAIAGHQLLVESMRGGREVGESKGGFAKRMSSHPPPPVPPAG